MTNPDIYLFGLKIAEPITSLTDVVAACIALYAGMQLKKRDAYVQSNEQRLFAWYFLLLGLATLWSGLLGHAFLYLVHPSFRLVGWLASGVAILLVELATNSALLEERAYTHLGLFSLIPWIQFAYFLFVIVKTFDFHFVQQNSVVGLIFYVLPLQYLLEEGTGSAGRKVFMTGIVLGILPAIVYSRQIAFSQWYNHHDLSHTLIAVVIYRMYRGIMLLGEEQSTGYGRPRSS